MATRAASCCCLLLSVLLLAVSLAAAQSGADHFDQVLPKGLCCATGVNAGVGPSCDVLLSGMFNDPVLVNASHEVVWAGSAAGQGDYYHAAQACRQSGEGRSVVEGALCVPVAGAGADPHVTGFDGSDYFLSGKPDTTYNLISERQHHVNIRLYHPPGRADQRALYIGAVGVLIKDARISVHLQPPAAGSTSASMVLTAHGAAVTKETVSWTGQPVTLVVDALTTATFTSPTHVVIASRDIMLAVVLLEDDHLDVLVEEVGVHWRDVHGIMGQTYRAAFWVKFNFAKGTAVGALPTGGRRARAAAKRRAALQGNGEDDYITSGLLMADDKFSRFAGAARAVTARKMLASTGGGGGQAARVPTAAAASAAALIRLPTGGRRAPPTNMYGCTFLVAQH